MSQPTESKRNFKKTLNLPATPFAMKANLVQNEPASIKRWGEGGLYAALRDNRDGRARFTFHDGPPYANGPIHLGHLVNKVLKDLVVRSRAMAGFDVPYVPGWDCHGLPIEHKVMQELGDKAKTMAPIQVRRKCRSYAEKFVKLQKAQMQRLLTLADYDDPYLTMNPRYESAALEVFAQMVERGVVYRGLKPVHWSIENRTALADAELEYEDREDTSCFALFEVDPASWSELRLPAPTDILPGETTALMIWTTTPWTLPANLAVAVHERFAYGLYNVELGGRTVSVVLATELAEKVLPLAGGEPDTEPLAQFPGERLVGLRYRHPFLDDGRDRRVVAADYVTLEDGTGLVHTAPGHGTEDYQTGLRENLAVYCPVLPDGTFDDTAPDWLRGQSVWDANDLVLDKLRESGRLYHAQRFVHSYPHDWRGKTPVIFRATEQWFVAVDKPLAGDERGRSIRTLGLEAVERDVAFYPGWGKNRLRGMLETRPDWCLSRQRAWGLPIPAFYPAGGPGSGEPLLTPASVRAVKRAFAKRGSDAWFTAETPELLPGYDPAADADAPAWAQEPGAVGAMTRSTDIFDVWFESGSSWHAVIRERFGHEHHPTDLYLEGSDQHRGWFQLSLLPSLACTGRPPFKAVLTHGFMVDKDGRKMSKSLGNTLDVEELLKHYGADVCRWWVSSLNIDNDIKVDESFVKVAGEEYRKVRNTVRFLLSVLGGFDPEAHGYTFTDADAESVDAWALGQAEKLCAEAEGAFERYAFRRVHRLVFDFCNDTLSGVYLAAVKDRLYCDKPTSPRRRRTQTAVYRIADALIRLLAPIMPHTADEAWRCLMGEAAGSVHLERFANRSALAAPVGAAMPAAIEKLRDPWLKAIESFRQSQGVDNPLDLGLRVPAKQGGVDLAALDPADLADLCGVSRFDPDPGAEATEVIDLRDQPRCERSWKRDATVRPREDEQGTVMLSDRDAQAVGMA